MPLSEAKVRHAKPGEKTVKLFDEQGLSLEISPRGGKWWRLKDRFEGKQHLQLLRHAHRALRHAISAFGLRPSW
jgi:hypothetical protein